jgi:hypothetical protein
LVSGVIVPPEASVKLFFREHFAARINDIEIAPQVELDDVEIGFDVVDDFGNSQVHPMHLTAVGAASLFPSDNQIAALGYRQTEFVDIAPVG